MLVQEILTAVKFTNRNEAFATKQTKEILPFVTTYNLGKNYLRKCFHQCTLPNATKLFPNQRLCVKKTPSPSSKLLPTNAQGSGFLLKTQQHCFQGEGVREESVGYKVQKKCPPPQVCTFLNSFVQDCSYNTNNLATNLKKILMKHWQIIQQQPKLKHIFNQPPIVSYRKDMSRGHSSQRENSFNFAGITKSTKPLKANQNLAICT